MLRITTPEIHIRQPQLEEKSRACFQVADGKHFSLIRWRFGQIILLAEHCELHTGRKTRWFRNQ